MKIVFTIFLLIFCLAVYSRTEIIGSGSGAVIRNNMQDLKPGDTLAIRAGIYENGGSFSGLAGITILNYGGIVDFGKTVSLGNLKMVTISGAGTNGLFYGIRFRNFRGDAFLLEAPCSSLRLTHCEYSNLDGTAFNASRFFTTYTGDTATLALYKTGFSFQKLVHSGALFVGSWASPKEFQNVVDSISFIHIIVDSMSSDVCQVLGQSIYRMLASHWRITGPCPNGKHDAGIFQIAGNGTVSNIYRKDGWGYIWRIWNIGLNGRTDSYLYNCIDLNTDNYGTIDTRMESGDTTSSNTIPFIRGGSMHILNNTIGNKRTKGYVSQLVIAGHFCSSSGYRLEVRNNLCFNTVATGYDQIVKQNTNEPLSDTSNNLYTVNPISGGILEDTIECRLTPSSPAIDKAIGFPFISTDIDGVPRPVGKSADIGAREFPDAAAIIYPKQGFLPKKWMILGLGSALIVIVLIVSAKKARKKLGNSTYKLESQRPNIG
jgi:hypothetical protein